MNSKKITLTVLFSLAVVAFMVFAVTLPAEDSVADGEHSVTYVSYGGTGDVPTQDPVAEEGTFTVKNYEGTNTGFSFGGWFDGTDKYTVGSTYTMGTADVTLTAIWTTNVISEANLTDRLATATENNDRYEISITQDITVSTANITIPSNVILKMGSSAVCTIGNNLTLTNQGDYIGTPITLNRLGAKMKQGVFVVELCEIIE